MAAEEEAAELSAAADGDPRRLESLVASRVRGEPLAWVTGRTAFCGLSLLVGRGVYVPRWQSEPLAERAAALLPPGGRAIDLCTGAGAIAAVLRARVPDTEVIGTDSSRRAVDCARSNGVDARLGDLDAPVPPAWAGTVDVVTAVPPYVPSEQLHLLDRDSREHEPAVALDGGPGGTEVLERVVRLATRWLRPRTGRLLVELGAEQDGWMLPVAREAGYGEVTVLRDDEGDVRGVEAAYAGGVTGGPGAPPPPRR